MIITQYVMEKNNSNKVNQYYINNKIRTRELSQHVSAAHLKLGFSHLMCIASFNISCSLLGAQFTVEKQFLF